MVYFTGARKYSCTRCSHAFRAPGSLPSLDSSGPGRPLAASLLIALTATLAATAFTWGTVFLTGKALMAFFIVAVIVSAGQGVAAGVLGTATSSCAILLLFQHTLSITLATHSMLGLFVVIAIVTNVVFCEIHRKNRELEIARVALERANRALQRQSESLAEANARLEQQKRDLAQAHEELRRDGSRLASYMRRPLKIIDLNTETLVRCDESRIRDTSFQVSSRIKREVRELGALIEDLDRAC